jgi:hypothetical protein
MTKGETQYSYDFLVEGRGRGPDGGVNALVRLPHRRIRQAHDHGPGVLALPGVHLDLHFDGIDALERGTVKTSNHVNSNTAVRAGMSRKM